MPVVLLVEDDPSTAETVSDVLTVEGHTVVQARDGHAAMSILARSERPCLVLLDLLMPGMDGDAVLDAMQRDRRLSSLPVVVTSALANMERIVRGRAHELLHKPFDLTRLLEVVCRYCHASTCQCPESGCHA